MLNVNADDYGMDSLTTDRIIYCFKRNLIHTASAMTFMIDSERAAQISAAEGLAVGLHLNLDTPFTSPNVNSRLDYHLKNTASYLRRNKFNQVIFNPFLKNSFEYVFLSQWEEFYRLYNHEPKRIDGHHHMHLSMNMILSGLIPKDITFRPNFTFKIGEKNIANYIYRSVLDGWLRVKYHSTTNFFSIKPINSLRLQEILTLAENRNVELMTHPGEHAEYTFLLSSEWPNLLSSNYLYH